jgi:hypothetical protein
VHTIHIEASASFVLPESKEINDVDFVRFQLQGTDNILSQAVALLVREERTGEE